MSVELNIPGVEILWFDDLGTGNAEYRFLSNFYVGEPIQLPGVDAQFPTGEHAFQAFKTDDLNEFHRIVGSPSPGAAKRAGRTCSLRHDWEAIKYDVMAAVVRAKFSLDRDEAGMLLATNDAYLREGTYWRDSVWGVDLRHPERPGRNWLGTLLMARRAELRAPCHDPRTQAYNLDFVMGL